MRVLGKSQFAFIPTSDVRALRTMLSLSLSGVRASALKIHKSDTEGRQRHNDPESGRARGL